MVGERIRFLIKKGFNGNTKVFVLQFETSKSYFKKSTNCTIKKKLNNKDQISRAISENKKIFDNYFNVCLGMFLIPSRVQVYCKAVGNY